MTSSSTETSPFDGDGAEYRLRSGVCRNSQLHARLSRARALDHAHVAVRKTVVAQLCHRHIVRRENEPLVARLPCGDRKPRLKTLEMIRRNFTEPVEDDVFDDRRLAFVDVNGDGDLVLGVVQRDVDADHFRSWIAAIRVERLDSLDVAIELRAIEKALARPWQESALLRGEDPLQLIRLHGVRAFELDRRHLHVARFATRRPRSSRSAGRSQEAFASSSRGVARLLLSGAFRLCGARAFCRFRARRGTLILREALPQALHQVDDLAFGRRLRRRQAAAFRP